MKTQFSLIFALAVESLLLILVVLVMIVGVLGVFLPFLPGLFLFGAGAALYSLLAKSGRGKITPFIDRIVINRFFDLPLIQKTMNFFRAFTKKGKNNVFDIILSHGLLLCGYNFALSLGFLFGFTVVTIIGNWVTDNQTTLALLSLLVVFAFSAISAVVWYRFGQLLGEHLYQRRAINAGLTVLISLLPLLALLIVFAGAVGYAGGFANEFMVIAFLGLLLMVILSSTFELLIVMAGVLTKTK